MNYNLLFKMACSFEKYAKNISKSDDIQTLIEYFDKTLSYLQEGRNRKDLKLKDKKNMITNQIWLCMKLISDHLDNKKLKKTLLSLKDKEIDFKSDKENFDNTFLSFRDICDQLKKSKNSFEAFESLESMF